MKQNNVVIYCIVLLSFLIIHQSSQAQATFVKGWVVLTTGDTLKGEIKTNPKRISDNYSKAAYRKKDGAEIKSYNPTKLKSYMLGNDYFVSAMADNEQLFMKLLSSGKLNLYIVQIEVEQMNEAKLVSDYYMQKGNGEMTKIKDNKFKKQMMETMADNPSLAKDIESKKYDYTNLLELFKAYNAAN